MCAVSTRFPPAARNRSRISSASPWFSGESAIVPSTTRDAGLGRPGMGAYCITPDDRAAPGSGVIGSAGDDAPARVGVVLDPPAAAADDDKVAWRDHLGVEHARLRAPQRGIVPLARLDTLHLQLRPREAQ